MNDINNVHISARVINGEVKKFDNHSLLILRVVFPNANKKTSDGFVDVKAWDELATANLSVKKGDKFEIWGELNHREWEKDGKKNSRIEIKANKLVKLT